MGYKMPLFGKALHTTDTEREELGLESYGHSSIRNFKLALINGRLMRYPSFPVPLLPHKNLTGSIFSTPVDAYLMI